MSGHTIIQALVKIEETQVVVFCRVIDLDITRSVLPEALTEFSALMLSETGNQPQMDVRVNDNAKYHLPAAPVPGEQRPSW